MESKLTPNSVLQGRYRIIRQLGRGGMGAVFEAMDENLSCLVAVKETFATTDEHRRAFEREAKLLANLHHHALPRVTHHFTQDDGQFLVMQFIPGNDLAELLTLRERPFPPARVLEWADHLLDALEELHSYNPPIVHRDIKPSNLKLTPKGKIVLLDFGLAKGAAGQMSTMDAGTYSHSIYGYTRHYAPLEQIRGVGTDTRSDLYSLAATLWTLLTNETPPDALARVSEKEDGNPDPLRPAHEINPEVPPAVSALLHQAMALNRNQRPSSATEIRKLLREASRQAEVEAEEVARQRAAEEARRREEQEATRQRAEAEARRKLEAEEAARRAEQEQLRREEQERRKREEEEARQRRLDEEEAARRRAAEEEQQLKEAEIRRREAEAHRQQQEEEQRKREQRSAAAKKAWETRRQAEEDMHRRETEEAVTEPAAKQERDSDQKLAISTLPVSRSEIHSWSNEQAAPSGASSGAAVPKPASRSNLRIIIGLAAFIIVAGVIALLLLQTRNGEEQSSSKGQSQTEQTASETTKTPTPPSGMAYVPGGDFLMGRSDGDDFERPAHKVTVKPFFIDIYEVTVEDYAKFEEATKGESNPFARQRARLPVTGVTWDDANAYAKWAGKRLPTEEEWEFAARGTDGRRYPWGNDWRAGLANADSGGNAVVDVGSYKGASPFGAYDMVGNAWEWTASPLTAYPGGVLPKQVVSGDLKVIRGGTYESNKFQATTTYRRGWPARGINDYSNTGFRCVKDITTQ